MYGPLPELPELTGSEETREEARRRGRLLEGFKAEAGITGNNGTVACDGMVDDTYVGVINFKTMIDFLHSRFFPRCEFALVSYQSCRTSAVRPANPFRVSASNIAIGTNVWKNWLPKGGCCQCTKFPPKFIHSHIGVLHIVTSMTSQNFK